MNFIDLQSQYQDHKTAIDQKILAVLDHGRFINGPEVSELEEKLASFVGAKEAIAL